VQAPEWGLLNLISTIGVYIIALSVSMFIFNVVKNVMLKQGKVADDDPWNADTLEWATTSPPPAYNFARIPVVHSARPLKEDVPH
jgi:cytochrome c oxidase subunit 1/cytochrome c oxidase subunit I+III